MEDTGEESQQEDRQEGRNVTTVVRRRPKPGREAEFERFIRGIVEEASSFPGHREARIHRPTATTMSGG